jgi:hypothetical protein
MPNMAARRTAGDNPIQCACCEVPLSEEGGSDKIIEGAELCAACAALLQEDS